MSYRTTLIIPDSCWTRYNRAPTEVPTGSGAPVSHAIRGEPSLAVPVEVVWVEVVAEAFLLCTDEWLVLLVEGPKRAAYESRVG